MPELEPFGELYSKAYDILNQDKDYNFDIKFALEVFNKYKKEKNLSSILDIGCGSGLHINCLPNSVRNIFGVDISENMIKKAKELANHPNSKFICSDVATLKLDFQVDFIISLFHVFSYQVTFEQIHEFFGALTRNLNSDGLVLFDFWHRAAWENDPPIARRTTKNTKEFTVNRLSTPKLDYVSGLATIDMDIEIIDICGYTEKFSETHKMKAFTKSEIEFLAKYNHFRVLQFGVWGDIGSDSLSKDSWYGYAVLEKLK